MGWLISRAKRILTFYVRGSITERLTSCLTGMDST